MNKHNRMGMLLALGSIIGTCLPFGGLGVYAAESATVSVPNPLAPPQSALDVILSAKGEMRGAMVDASGSPSVKAKVTLSQGTEKEAKHTITDEAGRFVFQGVRPGVYAVSAVADSGRTEKIVRVWREESAPPAATPVAVVKLQDSKSDDVVRGQVPSKLPNPEPKDPAGAPLPPDQPAPPLVPVIEDAGGGGGRSGFLLGAALGAGGAVGIVGIAGGFSSDGTRTIVVAPASP